MSASVAELVAAEGRRKRAAKIATVQANIGQLTIGHGPQLRGFMPLAVPGAKDCDAADNPAT